MQFVAIRINLHLKEHRRPSAAAGVYAHTAILKAISSENEELGYALHEMQRNKRITVAIVGGDRNNAMLRLTFMAQDGIAYANTLINALSKRPKALPGRNPLRYRFCRSQRSGVVRHLRLGGLDSRDAAEVYDNDFRDTRSNY